MYYIDVWPLDILYVIACFMLVYYQYIYYILLHVFCSNMTAWYTTCYGLSFVEVYLSFLVIPDVR